MCAILKTLLCESIIIIIKVSMIYIYICIKDHHFPIFKCTPFFGATVILNVFSRGTYNIQQSKQA